MIRAILFDLDGILVDFAGHHFDALNLALDDVCGRPVLLAERDQFEGLSTRQKLAIMVQQGRVPAGTEDAIYRLKQEHTVALAIQYVDVDPAKKLMCVKLRRDGFRLGCVSNCVRASVDALLDRSELRQFMTDTVSNEDVVSPKPSPDPYLLACRRLNVRPCEALAVEDHERGVQSATDAGCHVAQLVYQKVNYLTIRKIIDEGNWK